MMTTIAKPKIKDRPILFSGEMVRAILAGRKTQTRRMVKGLTHDEDFEVMSAHPVVVRNNGEEEPGPLTFGIWADDWHIPCPYGKVGDRLWVKESWQAWHEFNGKQADEISAEARRRLNYPANGNTWDADRRNPRFMPRWASRLTLEITGVKVERLNDINEADAMAEGFYQAVAESPKGVGQDVVGWFHLLWESINGKGSWDANPFVWVIEFSRV